ncbi:MULTISPECIES: GOLPH3/VPS74 family protein [Actinoalloteichus]|uniref:Golgi phosphoprotein 3 (GPP34) n=1 Tax=Actinoalloteichus fjordicus TaxID=1612552 RepID=A0AAC9LHY7_9PSEU|nr:MULTISPECIES: GPP34 family phosphoprotein [Actinoalloteichus]APU16649.1 Golgi phosphoprotein 3 (GPP34) [Actinoalloteichus fjordicus]APU22715.1 Golgi phosphoprotein 3 (GPP34) [Actinoalloteichus sp. GBA129-24]
MGGVDVRDALASRFYLLSCDLAGERLTARAELGYALHAATLHELFHAGLLRNERGKPAVRRSCRTGDAAKDRFLTAIGRLPPRPWSWWIGRGLPAAVRLTGERLSDAGLVRHWSGRALLIFPTRRVQVLRPEVVADLRRRVHGVLQDGLPVQRIAWRDVAMVSLAAECRLRSVLSEQQCARHDARLRELRGHVGPVASALHEAELGRQAAAAVANRVGSGGAGGGGGGGC